MVLYKVVELEMLVVRGIVAAAVEVMVVSLVVVV